MQKAIHQRLKRKTCLRSDLWIGNKDINLKIRNYVLRRNFMCGEVILQYNCFISQDNIVSVFINFTF